MNVGLSMSPSVWQALALGVLAFLLLLTGFFDVRERRVPNTLVLIALMTGVLLHALGPQSKDLSSGLFSPSPNSLGVSGSLFGALVALLVFLPFYVMRFLGAGDVKLLAGVGAFSGVSAFLNIALCVLLAGGLLALIGMVMKNDSRHVAQNTFAILGQLRPGSAGVFNASTQTAWRMPYAVAIACGVAAYAWWTLSGRAPILNF